MYLNWQTRLNWSNFYSIVNYFTFSFLLHYAWKNMDLAHNPKVKLLKIDILFHDNCDRLIKYTYVDSNIFTILCHF